MAYGQRRSAVTVGSIPTRITKSKDGDMMDKVPWDKLIKQGTFAALFISLLVYTVNANAQREKEYQVTIKQNNDTLAKYADIIKIDLSEIKGKLR
jgi:hypothetical protein